MMIKIIEILVCSSFFLFSSTKCRNIEYSESKDILPQSEHKVYAPTYNKELNLGIREFNDSLYYCTFSQSGKRISFYSIVGNNTFEYKLNNFFPQTFFDENILIDFCSVGRDSFLLLFHDYIVCFDGNGVFQKRRINEWKGKWPKHTISSFHGCSQIAVNKNKNIVYLWSVAADVHYYSRKHFEREIIITYNFITDELKVEPIFYPAYYKLNFVGDLREFSVYPIEDYFIISFLATNSVYKLKDNLLETIEFPKSNFDIASPHWLDWNKDYPIKVRIDNLIENRIYDNILNHQNLYFRFFRLGIPLLDSMGKHNTLLDKSISIMKLDSNFQLLGEFLLPRNSPYNSYNSFIHEGNLYINNLSKDASNESFICYDIFDLDQMQ